MVSAAHIRRVREYPRRYGQTWAAFMCPRFVWNECYRGIIWAKWWAGWTNPVYKRLGW